MLCWNAKDRRSAASGWSSTSTPGAPSSTGVPPEWVKAGDASLVISQSRSGPAASFMNEAGTLPRAALEPPAALGGLEVRSIAKAYDRRAVLHDVSLDVHRGEVVGLLGPNGAGKTTCFYSVMGLVKPDSGRIFLDG